MKDESFERLSIFIKFIVPLLILVIIAGFIAFSLHKHGESVEQSNLMPRATKILNAADLAKLPESAKNVHVYAYKVLFIARVYVSFEAEPEDIEKFLADSPALKKLTCHTYSKDRMRLATDDFGQIVDQSIISDPNIADFLVQNKTIIQEDPELSAHFESMRGDGHEYFLSIKDSPSWYKEEIRGAGRYYELSEHETSWIGELIVDDENHIVYMYRGN